MLTFLTFILFTAGVAAFTYWKTRSSSVDTEDGYFLGGRSLTAGLIAGSLMLTNLSAANFAGMSAQSFTNNMSVMGWEVFACFSLILVALFLLPRYLRAGITTIPDFLEDRFDPGVKRFVTILFLLSYVLNGLPSTLYAGAIIMGEIFDVSGVLGVTHIQGIWISVWAIGVIGSIYAIFGGLRAIAFSDTINGIGLVLGGMAVPYFGMKWIGDGNFWTGCTNLLAAHPEKFNSIGSSTDSLPFATFFTGLILVNMYYWGTDQGIIQRALAAKNLEHGQKGVMFAGLLKIFTPLMLIIPGIIAYHIYGPTADTTADADLYYSKLVLEVLPKPLVGFLAAVMFGAILSTFNSLLNSAATLFSLNIYKKGAGRDKSDKEVVAYGKKIGIIIAVVSMCIAPLIANAPDGLFEYLQTVNGFFNVPIFTIIFMGYVTKRVPAIAPKVALVFFVVSYGILQLGIQPDLHFLHQLAILFVLSCGIMLLIGRLYPREEPYEMKLTNKVDISPWSYRYEAAVIVTAIMISFFVIFSKLGLAGGTWATFGKTMAVLWGFAGALVYYIKNRKVEGA